MLTPSVYCCHFFLNVYLFILRKREEKEREREQGRDREKERERIPTSLHAVSAEPDMGLDLTNCEIMTGTEIKSDA